MSTVCIHHWVIESAGESGLQGRSTGVCRNCGASRLFTNSIEDGFAKEMSRGSRKGHRAKGHKVKADLLEEEILEGVE